MNLILRNDPSVEKITSERDDGEDRTALQCSALKRPALRCDALLNHGPSIAPLSHLKYN
jgi:hypothetical protein